MDRCCKAFCRAAASGQKVFTVLSVHINNVFAKKRGIAKKIIQTVRALMISQNIDLVAGDFNGAAATMSVLSMKYFLTVPCLRRRAPHHCGDADPSRTIGRTSVVFLSPLALNDFGKWTNMAHSLSLDKLLVYVPVIKAAIMRRGFICTSSIGTTNGPGRHTTTGTSV